MKQRGPCSDRKTLIRQRDGGQGGRIDALGKGGDACLAAPQRHLPHPLPHRRLGLPLPHTAPSSQASFKAFLIMVLPPNTFLGRQSLWSLVTSPTRQVIFYSSADPSSSPVWHLYPGPQRSKSKALTLSMQAHPWPAIPQRGKVPRASSWGDDRAAKVLPPSAFPTACLAFLGVIIIKHRD